MGLLKNEHCVVKKNNTAIGLSDNGLAFKNKGLLSGTVGLGYLHGLIGDNILQKFNTLYLTRFRTYKMPYSPPPKKKKT
jgi:hypothetical protein